MEPFIVRTNAADDIAGPILSRAIGFSSHPMICNVAMLLAAMLARWAGDEGSGVRIGIFLVGDCCFAGGPSFQSGHLSLHLHHHLLHILHHLCLRFNYGVGRGGVGVSLLSNFLKEEEGSLILLSVDGSLGFLDGVGAGRSPHHAFPWHVLLVHFLHCRFPTP